MDFIDKFREKMAQMEIMTDALLVPDGKLHRFHIDKDKKGTRNGWYVLYANGIPSGAFGSWRTGCSSKWCLKSRDQMTRAEWSAYRKRMNDACRLRDQERIKDYQQTAERAIQIWAMALPANPNHPYLIKKRIQPFIARQTGDAIVLPLVDCHQKIHSLQFIGPEGSKRLLRGGAKKGHFIPVSGSVSQSRILICEGYATGATLAQRNPGVCIISAVDAGNLTPVAIEIRRYRPHATIIVCADDDRHTLGNPGITKARQAAIHSGALLRIPKWPESAPSILSDFNDLDRWLHQDGGRNR